VPQLILSQFLKRTVALNPERKTEGEEKQRNGSS